MSDMGPDQRALRAIRRHLPGAIEAIRDEVIRREQHPFYWAAFHREFAKELIDDARAARKGKGRRPFMYRVRVMYHKARSRRSRAHAKTLNPALYKRMGMESW